MKKIIIGLFSAVVAGAVIGYVATRDSASVAITPVTNSQSVKDEPVVGKPITLQAHINAQFDTK